ncbi:MAG TPA: helix-turn-helix domain-containing protein [Anaerolineae bacterium]|nr:helix-turn-helix domain-containing protein [Anaerolineae bacterium]
MSDHFATETAKDEILLDLIDHSLPKAEATLIHRVLEETNWNLKKAAMKLEIARGTLYSKIKKYNIKRPAMPVPL